LGEFIVVKQRSDGVGHDELVGFFAVANGERVALVVLHESDDLELELFPIGRFDNEDVAEFEQAVVGCGFITNMVVGIDRVVRMRVVGRMGLAVR